MSAVTYYKGTTSKIRIEIDDSLLVAQGVTNFDLTQATDITTELESANGDFVKFTNSFATAISAKIYDIAPTATEVSAMQIGLHSVSGQVTVGGIKYGFKIKDAINVERLIQT